MALWRLVKPPIVDPCEGEPEAAPSGSLLLPLTPLPPLLRCVSGILSNAAWAKALSLALSLATDPSFVDSHGKFEEFKAVVPYHVDFHFFLRDNQDIVSKTGGKTGLSNSSETGILKIVTGNKPDQDKAHDALYDAEILHDLMFKYLKSRNWYHETMGSFRMNAVREINYGAIGQGLVRSRRRRVKNPSSCGIFYPPGFASFK